MQAFTQIYEQIHIFFSRFISHSELFSFKNADLKFKPG
jgi:hypothetical protein